MMNSKYYSVFVLLLAIKLVSSKSFTIVLDTTVSMQDEIDVIKMSLPSVAGIMKNVSDFEDFILVPFNDPDIDPPLSYTNPDDLIDVFRSLTATGGNECPEDSLAGIEKALEISKSSSFIFVFTDAHAKEITKLQNIQSLCKNTQSQVVIFLSGSCSGSDIRTLGYSDIFYEIAKSCSGAVFKFDSVSLRKAFNYIKETIVTDWNDIINHEPFSGYKQIAIHIDSFTTDFMLAISGDYPTLQIVDSDGRNPQIQKIVDTRQSLVVRVANISPGEYQISVRCQGLTSLTFYKKGRVPYQIGFSTRLPNSLKETSRRPMPGRQNYMLIVLPQDYDFKITSVELQVTDGSDKQLLSVEESQIYDRLYTTSFFVESSKPFRLLIHGRDSSYQEMTTTTKVIAAQEPVTDTPWSKPIVEIFDIENNLINFATNATVVCKIIGYPKPDIIWESEESTRPSEEILLEVPSVYLSYITINVTSNVTLYCKASNNEGTDEQHVELFVNRTLSFDVVQIPQNETFEYGSEGKLFCQVDAYPEAEIKWSHNDTSIEYSENVDLVKDENALVIKNMTLNDVGLYKCEASNDVRTESFEAYVSILGLEAPVLTVDKVEVDLKPGDWINLECQVVKGNPPPTITWEYQVPNKYDFQSVPSDVYIEGTQLKISVVKKEHKGLYRCLAVNMLGEDSKEVTVNIKYAPIISNSDDGTMNVKEGEMVYLPCEVDATPEATVKWEMQEGDAMVPLDSRHAVDDRYTHRFAALWKDSGVYRCIAENEVGRTEKTYTINVLVAPYIQPPELRELSVAAGSNVTLPCNVLYGNPLPSTKWEFIATDSTTTVLSRENSAPSHNLYLINVSRVNQGMYLCIADNEVGNDRIRMYLKVY